LGITGKTQPQRERGDKQQLAAFRKAAREIGADENEERFKETLRTLAKHRKPQSQPKKSK
jgi:hypothetical protein